MWFVGAVNDEARAQVVGASAGAIPRNNIGTGVLNRARGSLQ